MLKGRDVMASLTKEMRLPSEGLGSVARRADSGCSVWGAVVDRRCAMPKYLFYGSYTPEGFRGLMEEGGSKRIEAAKRSLGSVGGNLEAFYFSFGEHDFYIIVDLPDNVTATAVTSAGNVSGTFRIKGVALLTAEDMDEVAIRRVDFRPPGH